ncbi:MAG: MaoC family dehydratase N-terminal domain-containing protein, partial [Dehalococcoidales bacterium]
LGFDRIQEVLSSDPALTVLHGSTELESYQLLRPGDVITVSARIAKVRQRQGKMGLSRFVTFEISCRNQRNEPVASCRQMAIVY